MREISSPTLARFAAGLAAGCLILAATLLVVHPARAASGEPALAIVTIVDGAAQLMRGERRFALAEGVRLESQDVVETAKDGRLLRIEYGDGMALNLGPSTRLLIDPQFYGERGRFARVYLLSGWAKLKAPAAPAAATAGEPAPIPLLASPAVDVYTAEGSLVVMVAASALSLFVESGRAEVHERLDAKPLGEVQALRGGQFLNRPENAKSTLLARAAPSFIEHLPRGFLDTLPDRAAMFGNRRVEPKEIGAIGYDDARDWLAVEWTLRRPAMKRWRPLTRDAAFREALEANMAAHPEWGRVLAPQRYKH